MLGVLAVARSMFEGTFVDVGMNVGQTLLAVRATDASWEYIGFEPNPRSWLAASELVAANGFERCTIVPVGLADRTFLTSYLSNSFTDESGSIIQDYRDPERHTYQYRQFVSVVRGEEALREAGVPKVGVVKIDVEGAEMEVIRGLESVLSRDRPLMIVEVLPVYDAATPTGKLRLGRQSVIEEILQGLGYKILRLHPPQAFNAVSGFGVHADLDLTNYLLYPAEKEQPLFSGLAERGFSVSSE